MNKVILNLEGIALGELVYQNGEYIYDSYPENEKLASKYTLMYFYNLKDSIHHTAKILFPVFQKILENCSREDIVTQANIIDGDSDFEKLVKLSNLSFAPYEFYITKG